MIRSAGLLTVPALSINSISLGAFVPGALIQDVLVTYSANINVGLGVGIGVHSSAVSGAGGLALCSSWLTGRPDHLPVSFGNLYSLRFPVYYIVNAVHRFICVSIDLSTFGFNTDFGIWLAVRPSWGSSSAKKPAGLNFFSPST